VLNVVLHFAVFQNFLLLKENVVDNHWCVLRSAQVMSKKIGDVFPTFFPLILCSHKQWHLSSLAFALGL